MKHYPTFEAMTMFVGNTAPQLAPIEDLQVQPREVVTIAPVAVDLDVPAQAPMFSLGPGAPLGAGVDPVSGVFRWAITEADAGSTDRTGLAGTSACVRGSKPMERARGSPAQRSTVLSNGATSLMRAWDNAKP